MKTPLVEKLPLNIHKAVRQVINSFTEEEKKKIAGLYINIEEVNMGFDWEHRETMGRYTQAYHTIDYFVQSIVAYLNNCKPEEREAKFISVIEHELLHALGYDHEGIKKYREDRKAKL